MTSDGEHVTNADIEAMEVILGGISKLYPDEVIYSDGAFCFPITQEESFKAEADRYDLLVRVKLKNDSVVGTLKAGEIEIVETETRRVL